VFHFTRHFRAGLSYPAATRLEFWWCLLLRLRSMVVLTLKPVSFWNLNGTAKAVPHPKAFVYSKAFVGQLSMLNGADSLRRSQFALSELGSGLMHGTKERRPILEIGSEDSLDHALRELRYQAVQHHRGNARLIGQASPVQVG